MDFIKAGQSFLSSQSGGGQGGGGASAGGLDISSFGNVLQHANSNSQGDEQEQSMFSRVTGMLQNKAQSGDVNVDDVDEDRLMNDHDKVQNGDQQVGSGQIGNAAALGAIKNMLGSGGGESASSGGNSGFQEKVLGMAMANAGKMFDQKQSNGQAEGSKEDAMSQAGETVMKLLMKQQMKGMIGGGQTSGLSGLAKMLM